MKTKLTDSSKSCASSTEATSARKASKNKYSATVAREKGGEIQSFKIHGGRLTSSPPRGTTVVNGFSVPPKTAAPYSSSFPPSAARFEVCTGAEAKGVQSRWSHTVLMQRTQQYRRIQIRSPRTSPAENFFKANI
jgi:hypothetical protein